MSGTLRLRGSTSGYAELQAAAVAGDQTFILPAAGGTLLTTDSPIGNLTLELGSASAPSLRFEGDTDTGLFSSGANTLNLVTGGSNKLVLGATAHTIFSGTNGSVRALDIDSSGNLGVGTSSPVAPLVISNSGAEGWEIGYTSGTTELVGYNRSTSARTPMKFIGQTFLVQTGNPSLTNGLYQDSSGNVGIGTTSPSNLLHLNASSDTAIRFDRGGTKQLNIGTDSGQSFIASFESKPLAFATSTSSAYAERMRIDSSGRLLVGTSTARTDYFNNTLTAMLQVEGTAASGSTSRACVSIVNNNNLTNFETPILVFGRSRGSTLNSKTLAGSGTRCGHISFQGADGSDMVEAAFIAGEVDGDSGANDMPGRLVFSTTQDGNSSPTERMRLDDEGIIYHNSSNHGIGTFVTASAGTEKYAFRGHYGSSAGSYGGNISFTVWSNGNVENTNNSYGAISDIKLKENIVDANSQWNDLKALQVRNYNFKEGQTHTQIGLVAQEAELISPGLVYESPDFDEEGNDLGTVTKSVNYSVLYMKAVKAVQEAMERIETLEAKVAALEAQ